jgi:hypothetical protein
MEESTSGDQVAGKGSDVGFARPLHMLLIEHARFQLDGTLLEAWASHKSVKPKAQPTLPPADAGQLNRDFFQPAQAASRLVS